MIILFLAHLLKLLRQPSLSPVVSGLLGYIRIIFPELVRGHLILQVVVLEKELGNILVALEEIVVGVNDVIVGLLIVFGIQGLFLHVL